MHALQPVSLWSALTLAVMVTSACGDDTTTEEPMCQQGEVVACYPGPEGSADVGSCVSGTQTCEVTDGIAMWGACAGFVLPAGDDICNDGIDNDCDGHVDVQPPSLGICAADPSTPPPICTADQLKPDLTGLTKATFKFTGDDQVFIVPDGVQSIWVKLWGGGGFGVGSENGGGGFALAELDVIAGDRLTVIVGAFGQLGGEPSYGGGGGGGRRRRRRRPLGAAARPYRARHGGRRRGGGGLCPTGVCQGGAGGGAIGEDGTDYPIDEGYGTRGFGATPNCGGDGGRSTCGCTSGDPHGGGGLQFQGGSPFGEGQWGGGGGGGGGWFGGGAGSPDCGGGGGGGGGGSSHVNPEDGCVVAGAGRFTANTVDIDYEVNPEYSGFGLIVVYY
ncbi:hypothetical protein [Nannocystis sp.]|uniref:hypothetical protein n=1 Tax=Nannocystis sp. TaxID=1962667 RepID=UPI0025FF703A|nr:hypothetical protein [Nannocystis sp.]MBK7830422.1 hypothetical protein [Nannocystis sp.]